MVSAPRRESETGIHHVMNRGVDRQPVFFDDVDRVEFGRRLAAIHDEYEVTTLAYCLMGNHYHLLLRAPPAVLSEAMQHLASVYTRHTNDRIGRDGPLFRGRFHSIPVETDPYLMWVTRYIHRNPLALPGVRTPQDHRWSSYRAYLGLRRAPSFVDIAPVLALFGARPAEVAAFTEHRPATAPASVVDLQRLVDCGIAVDDLTHPRDRPARQRLDRTVTTLLATRCTDPAVRGALSASLGPRSSIAADAAAVRRASRRMDTDPMVQRIVAWVEDQLAA